jgi:fibronectin type 3 domain-containing protein
MKRLLIFIVTLLVSSSGFAQNENIAFAGKNGIFVHLGFDIPNGNKTDFFIVERKTEYGEWETIAKIKFPTSIDIFKKNYYIYKGLFPYINATINLDNLYRQLSLANTIQDTIIDRKIDIMSLRLAAGNVFYDQYVEKHVLYQYRVTSFKDDKAQSIITSELENYPGITVYSPVNVYLISKTDTSVYLKWWSLNGENPYWCALYHYDNDKVVPDKDNVTHYSVNDTVYYFTNIKLTGFKQYFIIPFDYYGNQGKASQIAYVEDIKPAVNYFSDINATKSDDDLQIIVSWTLKNSDDIKQINILRSENYDGEYKIAGSVSNKINRFIDVNIKPDKIYYYRLDAELTFSAQHVQTIRFYGFGYEKMAPIPPRISVMDNQEKEVKLKISGSNENFIRGVRIYRHKVNTQTPPELISDLIPLKADTAIYIDTANIEGGYLYEYFAKSENTSHLESDFSFPVQVQSLNRINFSAVTGFDYILYNKKEVHLYWDNVLDETPQAIGYRLYKRKEGGNWKLLLKKDSLFTLNRYIDKITNAGRYEYKVCLLDFLFRESDASILKVEIYPDEKTKGGDITVIATNKGIVIKPSQIAISGITKYKIYRYRRSEEAKMIAELDKSIESFLDKKVKKGKLYFYYITYIDNNGNESLPGKEASLRL